MMRLELKSMTTVDVDLPMLAKVFAAMNDDEQAQFFVEVAKIVKEEWPYGNGDSQWHYIGAHLRNCECATEGARDLIRGIAYGLEQSNHGTQR